jgi:ferredoxin
MRESGEMLTAAEIKRRARELGADAVAIGNIERWQGAPVQMDPREIMPEARSIIALAFRVCRGSLRGIEEGTFFSNYSSMGYGGITYLFMPMVVMNLARTIEDEGYEAIPYGHQSDWRAIDNEGGMRPNYSRPVAPGRAAPDVMVQLRIAAYLAGLGEIGYSKMFLTPQFGPRNRIGIVITEAELEPDPMYSGPPLCNRCMACVKACPGGALKADKTVKVVLAGREVEWTDIDCKACDVSFRGAQAVDEDMTGKSYMDKILGRWTRPGWWSPFYRKPPNLYNTGQAVCGARGCTRACIVSMESRGVLLNKFHKPFRRGKPWRVDWTDVDLGGPAGIDPVTGKQSD